MDAERASGGWTGAAGIGIALVAIVLLFPGRARAMIGHAVVQFQDIRQNVLVTNPDGSTGTMVVDRQFWVQNYDLAHSMNPRPNLNVFWQLQFNGVSFRGITQTQNTPYGTFRVNHTLAGLSASYRPLITTTGARNAFGVEQITTTRRNDSQISAYLAPPSLPRLDLTWQRSTRSVTSLPTDQTGTTRSAQLTYDRGLLNLHGSVGDDRRETGGAVGTLQRNAAAGVGYRIGESAHQTLLLSYDYAGNRFEHGRTDWSQSHNASATGSLRQSPKAEWTLYGNLRRAMVSDGAQSDVTDYESSLFYTLQATRAARVQAGGGARTLHTETGTGLQRYVSGVLTGDGRVNRVWQATGSLSSMVNWDPEHPTYTISSAHGGSRFAVYHGLSLDLDALLTATSDPTAIASRCVVQTSGNLRGSPLRTLTVTLSARRYQSGSKWFDGASESRGLAANIRLRPVPTLDLLADFSNQGSLPHNDPHLRTRQFNATWNASSNFRLSGYYTLSDRTQRTAAADALTGQAIMGGRLLASLSRSLVLNTGVSAADPRTGSRSRQADASLTWTFGGPS